MSTCDNCDGSGFTQSLGHIDRHVHTTYPVCQPCDGTGFVLRQAPEHGPTQEATL